MKRRNFLIGAGSAAIGGSALLGSGAFSRVESHRSMTVQIANDPNAYLGMDDCMDSDGTETPNSSYAQLDEFGHLQVDMTDTNPTEGGGQGVNSDSITWADNVFQICNQGKEPVCLWISEKTGADPGRVTLYVDAGQRDGDSTTPKRLTDDDPRTRNLALLDSGLQTFNGVEESISLEVGECVCVGVQVVTKEDDSFEITEPAEGDQLIDEIGLVADVNETGCRDPGTPSQCPNLVADYSCTTYSLGSGKYQAIGTRIAVENTGDIPTNWGYAIRDSPNEYEAIAETQNPIDAGDTVSEPLNAADPKEGFVYWSTPDDCPQSTWGEVKGNLDSDFVNAVENTEIPSIEDSDYANLIDFPEEVGTLDDPNDPNNNIPEGDFPDDLPNEPVVACRTL